MKNIPISPQGRIFAFTNLISTLTVPLVVVLGGWLADKVFEPAINNGGVFADTISPFILVSHGQGMAVVFFLCGLLGVVISLFGLLQTHLTRLEKFVPDGR